MKHRALLVSTMNELKVVEFDVENEYKTLSDGVGGYIECVRLPTTAEDLGSPIDMWVNEEGRIKGLPYNHFGSLLYTMNFRTDEPIVGDIVLTGGTDEEGNTLGLTDSQLDVMFAGWRNQ